MILIPEGPLGSWPLVSTTVVAAALLFSTEKVGTGAGVCLAVESKLECL